MQQYVARRFDSMTDTFVDLCAPTSEEQARAEVLQHTNYPVWLAVAGSYGSGIPVIQTVPEEPAPEVEREIVVPVVPPQPVCSILGDVFGITRSVSLP